MNEGNTTVGIFEGLWAVTIGKLFAVGAIAILFFQPGRRGGWFLLGIAILVEGIEKGWNMKNDESKRGEIK